jgi:hypothetical protein
MGARSKRVGGALAMGSSALLVLGCAGASKDTRHADPGDDDEPRRAPAVAVDPAPSLPAPASSADSTQSMIVLTTPIASDAARDLVRAFFRAVLNEAAEQLDQR